MGQQRKRWLKEVLKNIRKRKKMWQEIQKRKDCGKMEENGWASSSIKLYKTEPMIYSAGTAKTQQLESGGRLRDSNAAICRNSSGTLSMPWQFQLATVEKQVESKTVTLICLYSLLFHLSPHNFCYLPISFLPPPLSLTHTHTHIHTRLWHIFLLFLSKWLIFGLVRVTSTFLVASHQ